MIKICIKQTLNAKHKYRYRDKKKGKKYRTTGQISKIAPREYRIFCLFFLLKKDFILSSNISQLVSFLLDSFLTVKRFAIIVELGFLQYPTKVYKKLEKVP